MNLSGIKHSEKAVSEQRKLAKKEEARRREKLRRRNNAIRRVLGRRGKKRPFNPDQEIPRTMNSSFDYVYEKIVDMVTDPFGPGSMHSSHIASFWNNLTWGDVPRLSSLIRLYSHSHLFSKDWTFFNDSIKVPKPTSEELRLAGSGTKLMDTFCKLLAERLVKRKSLILEMKESKSSRFRWVLVLTVGSVLASVVGLIWLLTVLANPVP